MGRLSDMYGGKRMFVIGVGWLVICSILAGVSQGELMLDFARALQGLGPAAFLPSSVMLLGSVYRPGPRKNLVSAIPVSVVIAARQFARLDLMRLAMDAHHDREKLLTETIDIFNLWRERASGVLRWDLFCRNCRAAHELALVFLHWRHFVGNFVLSRMGLHAFR
jgi:hypothetical protein